MLDGWMWFVMLLKGSVAEKEWVDNIRVETREGAVSDRRLD